MNLRSASPFLIPASLPRRVRARLTTTATTSGPSPRAACRAASIDDQLHELRHGRRRPSTSSSTGSTTSSSTSTSSSTTTSSSTSTTSSSGTSSGGACSSGATCLAVDASAGWQGPVELVQMAGGGAPRLRKLGRAGDHGRDGGDLGELHLQCQCGAAGGSCPSSVTVSTYGQTNCMGASSSLPANTSSCTSANSVSAVSVFGVTTTGSCSPVSTTSTVTHARWSQLRDRVRRYAARVLHRRLLQDGRGRRLRLPGRRYLLLPFGLHRQDRRLPDVRRHLPVQRLRLRYDHAGLHGDRGGVLGWDLAAPPPSRAASWPRAPTAEGSPSNRSASPGCSASAGSCTATGGAISGALLLSSPHTVCSCTPN